MAKIPAAPLVIGGVVGGALLIGWLVRRAKSKPGPQTDVQLEADLSAVALATMRELGSSQGATSELRRLQVSFLRQRARRRLEQDPGLRGANREAEWRASLVASFHRVDQYVQQRLGTPAARGPYYGGASDLQPPHLDLARFANSRTRDALLGFVPTTDAEAVAATTRTKAQHFALNELDRRYLRVRDIVWRAAGVEAGVWDAGDVLREADLTELLDRRLRSIERLVYQASAGARTRGLGSSNIERRFKSSAGATPVMGPFEDDFSVRPFEAPSLPAKAFPIVVSATNGPDASRYELLTRVWYFNEATKEFDLDVWPGTRPGDRGFVGLDKQPQALPVWTLSPDEIAARRGYAWILTPQGQFGPASIVEELFLRASNADWLQRSLLHADGVLCALHLEALRHALLRRHGSDQPFDDLLARFDYVLGDPFDLLKHARVPRSIFAPGVTDHFQNEGIPDDELQVGDQLLFDVHPVFFGLSGREVPTAMVTSIAPEVDGTLRLEGVRVQGFDTADLPLGAFQRLLVDQLDRFLDVVRKYVQENANALSDSSLPWRAGEVPPFLTADQPPDARSDPSFLMRWRIFPADSFEFPEPYFIQVAPRSRIWRGLVPEDLEQAVARIPHSMTIVDSNRVVLVHERGRAVPIPIPQVPLGIGIAMTFPLPDHLYVALYEVEGGFPEYIRSRLKNPGGTWSNRLHPVRVDARMLAPARDANHRLRVVRPRLKQAP